jgi:hypothetical protein
MNLDNIGYSVFNSVRRSVRDSVRDSMNTGQIDAWLSAENFTKEKYESN